MTPADWGCVAVIAASALLGAWRGLVFEVMSLLGWVVSFFVAQWFAVDVGQWLPMADVGAPLQYAAGFGAVFVATMFGFGLVAWLVKKLVEAVGLRPVDRVLGACFGLVRAGVLLLAVTVVVSLTPLKDAQWWQSANCAPILVQALGWISPLLPEQFGKLASV